MGGFFSHVFRVSVLSCSIIPHVVSGFTAVPSIKMIKAPMVISSSTRLYDSSRELTEALPTSLDQKNSIGSNNNREKILSDLDKAKTGTAARKIMNQGFPSSPESSEPPLYSSIKIPKGASVRRISDADLAIQTQIRTTDGKGILSKIELNGDSDIDRASLFVLCLTIASVFSATFVNENFSGPEIIRFVIVWILSFLPLIFVGFGLSIPEKVFPSLMQIQRVVFPTYRKRMIQHEAGHFLMGHLLGFPVKSYKILGKNSLTNACEFYPLSDSDVRIDAVKNLGFDLKKQDGEEANNNNYYEEDKPFFSPDGRGSKNLEKSVTLRSQKSFQDKLKMTKIPSQNNPKNSWPYRGFDTETIDMLSVISLAGVCSEILAFGNAEGGYADINQLTALMNAALSSSSEEDNKKKADEKEKEVENQIKFAIGYAYTQLRRHLGALDALAEVMERDGSIQECIQAIENSASENNIALTEEQRRIQIYNECNVFEKALLYRNGGGFFMEEDGEYMTVEGKGGGELTRKKKGLLNISGDDPFYLAGALAIAFFVWASSGGLSLH